MFNDKLEKITTEKHVEAFEHFVDLFEIDHDDLCLRIFAKSLQGDVKKWFTHLQFESIDSWTELREVFLSFWGERKSCSLLLSEFYAMRKMQNETISTFNRRFFHLYHKMPRYFQPPEGVAKLYYANSLHSDLSLHLLERRSDSLQQMFIDAQEFEENIRASGNFLSQVEDDEKWIADGHKTDCGK